MNSHTLKVLATTNQPYFNENCLLNPQTPPEMQIQASVRRDVN
jgi:hypothetical protein